MPFAFSQRVLLFFIISIARLALYGQAGDGVFIAKVNVGPFAQSNSTQSIYGILNNNTPLTINEFTINWREDQGEIHAYTISNINIQGWSEFLFWHFSTWSIGESGNYNLSVWIDGINNDPQWLSDTLTVAVVALETTAQRMLLYESFSSISCGTCAEVNPIIRETALRYAGKAFYIGYQVDCWAGNPMCLMADNYIAERVSFYEVVYTPYSVLGHWYSGNSHEFNTQFLDAELARPSVIDITGNFSIEGGGVNIALTATPFTPIETENLVLKIAITQDVVSFESPPGSNGEKDFYHVLRRFAATPVNTLLPLEDGNSVSFSTFEDFSDLDVDLELLRVGVFIQDTATLEVIQAAELDKVTTSTNVQTYSYLSLFPNPANEFFTLEFSAVKNGTYLISIYSSLGLIQEKRVIVSEAGESHVVTFDSKKLGSGMYIVKVNGPEFESKQKIIVH